MGENGEKNNYIWETLPKCPKCGEAGILDKRVKDDYKYICSHCGHIWPISKEEYLELRKYDRRR